MGLFDFFRASQQKPSGKRRPAPATAVRMTQVADNSRLSSSWVNTPYTADALVYRIWSQAVARSRQMREDADHMRKFVQMVRDNVAGPVGFSLNAQIRDPNGTMDTVASEAIETAFYNFSKRGNFDVTGTISRADLERLALSSWTTDGEVIANIVYNPNLPFGIGVQLMDPVRLDAQKYEKLPNGNIIRHGIEFNDLGRPVRYHFRNYDEQQLGYLSHNGIDYTVVDARNIVHWFLPEIVGQKRGLPAGRTALWRMQMLQGFEDAALVNARAGAAKMGFFKDPDANPDDVEDLPMDVEPGVFENIGNREFIPYSPQFPDAAVEQFVKVMLRSIASGLGCSYNNLASDLTSVNFSSIRQGALDEREVWKGLQESFISGFCVPIYERWLEYQLLAQSILIAGKPLRFERLEKYKAVVFTGRRWSWIDPAAEQSANEKAVAQGFKSRSDVIREMGRDPVDVWDEVQRDNEELRKRNIVPLVPAGTAPPQPQTPDIE